MIKTRGIMARAVMFLVITSLMVAFTQPALAAQVTENKIIPAGQSTFSIDMYVNEPTKYAGIEFVLTISDENALKFESFTPKISGATASPFQTKNGLHYFGFMAAGNDYAAGNTLAGTLNFTEYTGNQAVGVTIVQMTVIRVDADNKSVKAPVDLPYAYTVQRPGAVVTYNVTFDANGGTFAGGASSEVISVPSGGTAVAPRNPTKAGYTFTGWDPSSFTNITSDITVTAQWRQNGGSSGTGGSGGNVNVPTTDVPTT
ncbi:MAG: InlB B-repeat-containing protein, partial [Clostridiales bacterium]|nr:InlB B-repeat-containing protein [Clostridiales bacterium]